MAKIKVFIKKPFSNGEVAEIENNLESFQNIVDGYIEPLLFKPLANKNIIAYCNEEAVIKGTFLPNVKNENTIIFGNIVFFKTDGENEMSLSDDDIAFIKEFIKKI